MPFTIPLYDFRMDQFVIEERGPVSGLNVSNGQLITTDCTVSDGNLVVMFWKAAVPSCYYNCF